MNAHFFRFGVLVLIGNSVAACGSGAGGTTGIAGFQACGGPLAGNWRVVATAVDIEHSPIPSRLGVAANPDSCDNYITALSWNAVGTSISFVPTTSSDPDVAVYERTIEGNPTFVETLSISAACATEGFQGASCELIAASLEPNGEGTCDTSTAPCTCTFTNTGAQATTVMVTAHAGELTTDAGVVDEYCRKGETLEQAQRGITGNVVAWMQLRKI